MKRIFIIIFFFLSVVVWSTPVFAQSVPGDVRRYATCDVCGYCVNGQEPAAWPSPPGDWPACVHCLYPVAYPTEVNPDPKTGESLLVESTSNVPVTPAAGRHFFLSMCVKTQLDDFTQTGAASSLVQLLLNIIFATAGGVALLYIIYGSFIVITSQAEPERLAYGKRVIVGAIIGLVFVFCSVLIVNLLAKQILRLPGFGNGQPPP